MGASTVRGSIKHENSQELKIEKKKDKIEKIRFFFYLLKKKRKSVA
jgi:hypothetical protein